MFNLFRMDLRRLVRTRSFYIILVVTAALIMMLVALVATVADPEKIDSLQSSGMVVTTGSDEEISAEIHSMTQLDFAHECLSSGFLLMIICIGVTLFVHGDFSSGTIKNICFAHPQRWEYILSKILLTGVYSGIVMILGVLVSLAGPILFGLRLPASPVGSILQYAFWLWLPYWGFGLMGLALVLLTRSSTLSIIMATLSGCGLIGIFLQYLCQRLGWPDLERYLLSSVATTQCMPMLGAEEMTMILACVAGWGALYIAGSLVMIEKRDI